MIDCCVKLIYIGLFNFNIFWFSTQLSSFREMYCWLQLFFIVKTWTVIDLGCSFVVICETTNFHLTALCLLFALISALDATCNNASEFCWFGSLVKIISKILTIPIVYFSVFILIYLCCVIVVCLEVWYQSRGI